MLVVTRKQSETIQIGDDIVIKVIQKGRGGIKLGIDAPATIRVLRGEVAKEAIGECPGRTLPSAKAAEPSSQPVKSEHLAKWQVAK